MAAMLGVGICNDNDLTPEELWQLIWLAFPNADDFKTAVKSVRAKIAERDVLQARIAALKEASDAGE
jgi:hypothetical protein